MPRSRFRRHPSYADLDGSVAERTPALCSTGEETPHDANAWGPLVDQFPETGLWPLALTPLAFDGEDRPWASGELVPIRTAAVDALDAAAVLEEGWADSLVPMGENPYVDHLRPFGAVFPGLAPALRPAGQPLRTPADVRGVEAAARWGLVRCSRPADAVAVIGWQGAINRRTTAQVCVVLRSWEDRFGVLLASLGFATLTLLVPDPPEDEEQALPIAAELAALCPDVLSEDGPVDGFGYVAGGTIEGLARALVARPVWKLWWD